MFETSSPVFRGGESKLDIHHFMDLLSDYVDFVIKKRIVVALRFNSFDGSMK